MPLTPEQIKKLEAKYGPRPTGTATSERSVDDQVAEEIARLRNLDLAQEQKTTQQASQQSGFGGALTKPVNTGIGVLDAVGNFGRSIGEAGVGAVKGAGKTAFNMSRFGSSILAQTAGRLGGGDGKNLLEQGVGEERAAEVEESVMESLKPTNAAQKFGFAAEQIGELFIPIPALAGIGKGKGLIEAGKFALKEGAELAGKRALQTGGDLDEVKKAFTAGVVGGVVGKTVLEPLFNAAPKAIAHYLEKTNLRLTPTQKVNLGKSVDDVVDLIQEEKLLGSTATKLDKIDDLYVKQEGVLQQFFKTTAKDRTIPKDTLISQLNGLKAKYQFDRDVLAIERQIDNAIATITRKFPDDIPVEVLNNLKRTTYESAYNRAGDKVLDAVEHDIADIARLNIEQATRGLKVNGIDVASFNEKYGKIINAKKLLKIAAGRAEIGLMGKLLINAVGGAIGAASGGPLGAAAGIGASTPVANVIAGSAARTLVSQGLSQIAKLPAAQAEQAILRVLLPLLDGKADENQSQ